MVDQPTAAILREKRQLLAAQVGHAISDFAMLEMQLLLMFAGCLGLPIDMAAKMLQPIRNFSTTLDVIAVVVRHRLISTAGLPYWASLLEYIRELSGDRNYLAHSPVIMSSAQGKLHAEIGPSAASILAGGVERIKPMPLEEIEEVSADFREAAQHVVDLRAAMVRLAIGKPLPDKFCQQVTRRRPSRGIRQGAERPAQPSRPPSSRPLRDKKKERGEKK